MEGSLHIAVNTLSVNPYKDPRGILFPGPNSKALAERTSQFIEGVIPNGDNEFNITTGVSLHTGFTTDVLRAADEYARCGVPITSIDIGPINWFKSDTFRLILNDLAAGNIANIPRRIAWPLIAGVPTQSMQIDKIQQAVDLNIPLTQNDAKLLRVGAEEFRTGDQGRTLLNHVRKIEGGVLVVENLAGESVIDYANLVKQLAYENPGNIGISFDGAHIHQALEIHGDDRSTLQFFKDVLASKLGKLLRMVEISNVQKDHNGLIKIHTMPGEDCLVGYEEIMSVYGREIREGRNKIGHIVLEPYTTNFEKILSRKRESVKAYYQKLITHFFAAA